MDFNDIKERKARSKKRWNLIAILLFFIATPPVGVGIFIANKLDILPDIGGSIDIEKSLNNLGNLGDLKVPESWRSAAEPEQVKQKRVTGMPKGGSFITILGTLGAVIGAVGGVWELLKFLREGYAMGHLIGAALWLSLTAGGIVAAIFGGIRRKKYERFASYLKLIGDKQAVPIHYLADVMGLDYHKVIKDLREMITRGILQPAWLDLKTYRLMLTEYTQAQAAQPEEKKEEAVSRSDRILRQIRADNDLIADEEVSRKIDRIEDLTRKIFAILDERPEKEEKLYSFLNYYLPTTLKALESYARLEAQGIETASIREAKQKINRALDELAVGYENQLDKLFEDDVVDITADIDVMRQMLHKDGLKEDEILTAVKK